MESRLFYKNLRYLRKKKRITQEEMGKMLGMQRSTYAYMEKYGVTVKITPLLQKVILKEFCFTIDELLNIDLSEKANLEIGLPKPEAEREIDMRELDIILLLLEEAAIKIRGIKKSKMKTENK